MTPAREANWLDCLAYICYAFAFGAGVGLVMTIIADQWPYLIALVVLATVGGWFRAAGERKAKRDQPPYVIAAARVWEARANDGAPLTAEDEERLPPDTTDQAARSPR